MRVKGVLMKGCHKHRGNPITKLTSLHKYSEGPHRPESDPLALRNNMFIFRFKKVYSSLDDIYYQSKA